MRRRLLMAVDYQVIEPINAEDYLTMVAEEDGFQASFSKEGLEYCIDASGQWMLLGANVGTTPINIGQSISFRGNLIPDTMGIGTFSANAKFRAEGNCMSILCLDQQYDHYFYRLFNNNTFLTSVSPLFLDKCTITPSCFGSMFYNCSNLKQAPKLKSTFVAQSCYSSMFESCKALESAPELPALTLAQNCYNSMFEGCSALIYPPELPALNLARSCYYSMFASCSKLTQVPKLPAMQLDNSCYSHMFQNCRGLTTPPELPALNLASYCYEYMFSGCYNLQNAPELPATSLKSYCYYYMFYGCEKLTIAPYLPALYLETSCYVSMFNSCYYLRYIKADFIELLSGATNDWVKTVLVRNGTFVKHPQATWNVIGNNGVPSGWTIITE